MHFSRALGRGNCMDISQMEQLIREATQDADLHVSEIPSIDLYLDQITSLVSDKRREASKLFEERVLTKTMINNYSKDGLLSPIKGKKYTKEQILQMLLVYDMKNTLSIGEIKRILQSLYCLEEYDAQMLEEIYSRYLSFKETSRACMAEKVCAYVRKSKLDMGDESDFLLLLLSLSAVSSYLKNTVQVLLSEHYPELINEKEREEQEKQEKKEEKEDLKRQRAEQKAEWKRQKSAEKDKKERIRDAEDGEEA